ncbi:MAG: phosphatidate cytidylyltransferase [Planctomycetia bacterium]|nr:phosphatidate cytidylyltransferase [Planctomycetia bacterium]
MDYQSIILISGVLLLLTLATTGVEVLRRHRDFGIDTAILDTCRSRIRGWWLLFGALTCALLVGTVATVFLFGLISFWALREYITLTPTRPADHRTLVWVFFLCTPLQFILVGINDNWFRSVFGIGAYSVYSVLIPAYAFLILPASIAVSGDSKRFLERIAKIQVGLLICVYSLSFAPALLTTHLPGDPPAPVVSEVLAGGLEDRALAPLEQAVMTPSAEAADSTVSSLPDERPAEMPRKPMSGNNLSLLFVFVLLVQLTDIFQYLWSQVLPQTPVAPSINSNKTWEGVFMGAFTTALVAVGLWYFTPFDKWWQPAICGFIISLMGFAGSITMSAIKRDRGVEDYGNLIEGHNGVLDRIDSLCFAAPVFYHLVWIFVNLELIL